jgi:hypothetical protein
VSSVSRSRRSSAMSTDPTLARPHTDPTYFDPDGHSGRHVDQGRNCPCSTTRKG